MAENKENAFLVMNIEFSCLLWHSHTIDVFYSIKNPTGGGLRCTPPSDVLNTKNQWAKSENNKFLLVWKMGKFIAVGS